MRSGGVSPSSVQPIDSDLTTIAAISGSKGDALVHDGTSWVRQAVGADGRRLMADSAQSSGLVWHRDPGYFVHKRGITLSSWEIDPLTGYFRQLPGAWADAADAIAVPPPGHTFANTANLTSAAISGGILTMVHNGSSSDSYSGGTATSPYLKITTMAPPSGLWRWAGRIQLQGTCAANDATRVYLGYGNGRASAGFDILAASASSFSLRAIGDEGVKATPLSGQNAATASTGWCIRLTVDPNTGGVVLEYATGQATEPTTWTTAWRWRSIHLFEGAITGWVLAHVVTRGGAGGASPTAVITPFSERVADPTGRLSTYQPFLGAGYATAAQDFVLYDDVFVGSIADADIASAQETKLAEITNKLPGDASQWAAKIERSNTLATYSGGSFANLGALAVSGTGVWCRVTARSTATSTAAGASIDLRRADFSLAT